MSKKSVIDWFNSTSQGGEVAWRSFYKSLLGQAISQPDRFFKALDNFGHPIMFEAVIAASTKKLGNDPLNYVIAIAVAKVNEQLESITASGKYALSVQKAKQRVEMQNDELESKIVKALGEKNVITE